MERSKNCSVCESPTLEISFLVENIVIPLVGGLGIVGNILAIVVLKNTERKSTFHQSLVALASCDIMFLSLILMDYSKHLQSQFYVILFPYFLNPMKNILLCWGTFLTMSITTERYLAVCKPFLYRTHKLRHSALVHLLSYILPPIIMAIIINIPKFLEAELVIKQEKTKFNISRDVLDFRFTSLRLNPTYIYYYTHLTRLIFTGVIPFFSLLHMNKCIFKAMRSSKNSLKQMPGKERLSRKKIPQKSLITLGAIVMLYLVCNTPRLLLNCFEYHYISIIMKDDFCVCNSLTFWFELLLTISQLCLVINSSVNILIYVSISAMFKRKLLLKLHLTHDHSSSPCGSPTLPATTVIFQVSSNQDMELD